MGPDHCVLAGGRCRRGDIAVKAAHEQLSDFFFDRHSGEHFFDRLILPGTVVVRGRRAAGRIPAAIKGCKRQYACGENDRSREYDD